MQECMSSSTSETKMMSIDDQYRNYLMRNYEDTLSWKYAFDGADTDHPSIAFILCKYAKFRYDQVNIDKV